MVVLALNWHSIFIYCVDTDLSFGYPGSKPSSDVWEIFHFRNHERKWGAESISQNKTKTHQVFFLSLCSGNKCPLPTSPPYMALADQFIFFLWDLVFSVSKCCLLSLFVYLPQFVVMCTCLSLTERWAA